MARKPSNEYQNPSSDGSENGGKNSPGSNDTSAYESPDDAGVLSAEAADAGIDAFMAGIDSQILAVKAEIEKLLATGAGESRELQTQEVMDANIVGVGIGLGNGTSLSASHMPGNPVLEVYTIEPESAGETRARLASIVGVSALASSDFPLHVVHTGIVDAQPHRMRLRPAPGGISVGHRGITAGTFGCLVRGRSAPRNARLMILSNNHVLANTNAGPIGESILQPGPFDGGTHPASQVAVLERFQAINFAAGASNLVDCATGWCWPDRVRRELMYLSGSTVQLFTVGLNPAAPTLGMQVGKSGRTTQLTRGNITAVGVTVNVNFGGGRVARFVDQFSVRAPGGDFSQGGDSGSLVWRWDATRAPVGLLFAGGGGTTFCNRITSVLNLLDVNIV
ncbi:MAG: S1 family peptidase [Rubrivivax sp.]|nr:S1 family peptidase [Rubrivivax sp.]